MVGYWVVELLECLKLHHQFRNPCKSFLYQVIVGSFIADGKKSKTGTSSTPSSHMLNFGAPMTGASPSPGASSESGEDNDDSPLNRGSGPYGNAGQPGQNMPMYSTMGWPNSIKMLPN
ncbi:UNVERIFIED_CONTAM: hypothetical protein Sradi_4897200 [Sesamum radiatum]|uniref:AT-hook motif nuclear-localized protein n=1 Tax=Sesamum radiatum TaxID=300843 RepID=A0AAW2MCG0_SESRA